MANIGKNETIVSTPDGLFTVPNQDLQQALDAGASLATPDQITAHYEAEEHPISGRLKALAYAAGKGATFGFGPGAFIRGAEAIGSHIPGQAGLGESARQAVRGLEAKAEMFPEVAIPGEIGGMLAGTALTAGLGEAGAGARGIEALGAGAEVAGETAAKTAAEAVAERAIAPGLERATAGEIAGAAPIAQLPTAAETGLVRAAQHEAFLGDVAASSPEAAKLLRTEGAAALQGAGISELGVGEAAAEAATQDIAAGLSGAEKASELRKAIGTTAQFAKEGAVYGAGEAFSDSAIQNKDLTAQTLLAGMGEGALWNGLMGAGIAGIGATGRKVSGLARAVVPEDVGEWLAKKEADAIWEGVTGNAKKITEKANRTFAGGHQWVVGAWDHFSPKWFGKKLEEVASLDEMLQGGKQGLRESGKDIGSVLSDITKQGEKEGTLRGAEEWIADVKNIADEAKKAGPLADVSGQLNAVRKFARGMEYSLGMTDEYGRRVAKKREPGFYRFGKEIDPGMYDAEFIPGPEVPFRSELERIHFFRQQADRLVSDWKAQRQNTDLMKQVRDALEGRIESEIERIGGTKKLEQYRAAKRENQAARFLVDGIERRKESGGFYAKTASKLAGAIGGTIGGALGGGYLGGAAGYGIGQALGEAYKAEAPFFAAKLLRSARKLAAIEHIETNVEKQITNSISAYIGGESMAKLATAGRVVGIEEALRHKDEGVTEETVNKIHDLAANPDKAKQSIEQSTAGMDEYAPGVQRALVDRAMGDIQYLSSIAPKQSGGGLLMRKRPLNAYELNKFNEAYAGVTNPMSVLRNLKDGNLTQTKIDAVKQRRPDILMMQQKAVMDDLWNRYYKSKQPPKLTRKQKHQLSTLMQAPIDDTNSGDFIRDMQGLMDNRPSEQGGKESATARGGGRRPIKLDTSAMETSSQQIESEEQ